MKKLIFILLALFLFSGCYLRRHGRTRWAGPSEREVKKEAKYKDCMKVFQ